MNREPSPPRTGSVAVTAGTVIILLSGTGWFALSRYVMETATVDALGEALGVMLGLLVLVSIVGAIASSRGNHR
ncbi:MAG TPA: hypothetical protein VK028_16285 [Micromonosporaceae bacterium]|nr:hypothetical protein [Micromonosporaceae bacterium]